MILQGNPEGPHVWAHVSEKRDTFRMGMGIAKDNNQVEISFTPVAEERLWRILDARRNDTVQLEFNV